MKSLPELEIERLKKTIEKLLLIAPSFKGDLQLAKELGERVANLEIAIKELTK